jgi:hypothetical protein
MLVFSVGPDELNEYDSHDVMKIQENYVWLVYWYENYGYEGFGEAVALDKEGRLQYSDLGHCSCYGPMESFPSKTFMTVEEFFVQREDIHDVDFRDEIKEKVKSLMGR